MYKRQEHGYSFAWEASSNPYTRAPGGAIIALTVNECVPYLMGKSYAQLISPLTPSGTLAPGCPRAARTRKVLHHRQADRVLPREQGLMDRGRDDKDVLTAPELRGQAALPGECARVIDCHDTTMHAMDALQATCLVSGKPSACAVGSARSLEGQQIAGWRDGLRRQGDRRCLLYTSDAADE